MGALRFQQDSKPRFKAYGQNKLWITCTWTTLLALMTIKRQLLFGWPVLIVANVALGFWDRWPTRDFVSLGVVVFIGLVLAVLLRSQCRQP